jgi:hypothetical protein
VEARTVIELADTYPVRMLDDGLVLVPADVVEARAREWAHLPLRDACPYIWGTPAAEHFTAHWVLLQVAEG